MRTLLSVAAIALAAGGASAQEMTSQDFIQQAASGGMFEVQSSELAVERSQDEAILAFAQMMITDHTAANEQLAQLAEQEGLMMPEEIEGEPADHMAAVEQASDEEFDASYAEHQVAAHEAAVELFRTYSEQGEVEALATFAGETLPKLESHLEMAQDLKGQ